MSKISKRVWPTCPHSPEQPPPWGDWPPQRQVRLKAWEETALRVDDTPPPLGGGPPWQKFTLVVVSPRGELMGAYPYWVRCNGNRGKNGKSGEPTFSYPHLYRTDDGNLILEFGCECDDPNAGQ